MSIHAISVNNNFSDSTGNITLNIPGTITITQPNFSAAVSNSTLIPDSLYKIIGVDPSLYNDGTGVGTTIYIKTYSVNGYFKEGVGVFRNIKIDLNNNINPSVWRSNIAYLVGDKIAWGGYMWLCIINSPANGGSGANAPIIGTNSYDFILGNNFTKILYSSDVDYVTAYDKIIYNNDFNYITSREDLLSKNKVSYIVDVNSTFPVSPIKMFAFYYRDLLYTGALGIFNTTVENSRFNNINANKLTTNIKITENSFIKFDDLSDNYALNDINFIGVNANTSLLLKSYASTTTTFISNSTFKYCTLTNWDFEGASISHCHFEDLNLNNLAITRTPGGLGAIAGFYNCNIKGISFDIGLTNRITGKVLGYLKGDGHGIVGSLNTATNVFMINSAYHASKTIYTLPNGEVRITTRDNANTEINTLITI